MTKGIDLFTLICSGEKNIKASENHLKAHVKLKKDENKH